MPSNDAGSLVLPRAVAIYRGGCCCAGETMISGITGEEFNADIFIGPVYYQRLRHMVADKFQVTSMGSATRLLTTLHA